MSKIIPVKSTKLVETTQNTSTDANVEHLSIDGSFQELDFPSDIPASSKTIQDVSAWAMKQRMTTQSQLALMLTGFLGSSILITSIFMGFAAFNSNADKPFIKDMSSQILNSQIILFGVVLGYYFGKKGTD